MAQTDDIASKWLLNLAVERAVPQGLLFPSVETEALNAKSLPGYCREDFGERRLDLYDSELITLSSEVAGDIVEDRGDAARIIRRFIELSSRDPRFLVNGKSLPSWKRIQLPEMCESFALTTPGGEAWESFAAPQ